MENKTMFIIIDIIQGMATLFMFIIVIRSLMTWLRQDVIMRFYKFFDVMAKIADPFLNFIRKMFPSNIGRVDLTPMIALLLIEVAKFAIIYLVKVIFKA